MKKKEVEYEVKEVGYYGLIAALERFAGYVDVGLENSLAIDKGLIVVEGLELFDDMMEHLS